MYSASSITHDFPGRMIPRSRHENGKGWIVVVHAEFIPYQSVRK